MTDSDDDDSTMTSKSQSTSEADDFDDDSFWTHESGTNDDAMDQCNEMENVPTSEEIELWNEVRGVLDSEELVPLDSDKARQAMLNASRYCKTSTCQEALSFIDNCTVKIVSRLLSKLDFDCVSSDEKNEILCCLKSAFELVSYDLVGAMEAVCRCKTLPAFLDIFDDVNDFFRRHEIEELITAFKEASGFWHLQQYLVTFARTTKFPRLDEISMILTVVHKSMPGLHFSSKEAKMKRRTQLENECLFVNYIAICRGTMHHLMHLEENALVQFGDEFLDIFDQVNVIYACTAKFYPGIMGDYHEMLRAFVLRLINSSVEVLKLIGWTALLEVIKISCSYRPPPRAYLVHGASQASFNGRYDYDEKIFDPDGFTGKSENKCTMYVKAFADDRSHKVEERYLWAGKKVWCIGSSQKPRNGRGSIDGYKAKSVGDNTIAPRFGWFHGNDLLDRPLRVTPVGLIVKNGEEFSTMEHDLVHWIFTNGVLELAVENAKSSWQCTEIVHKSVEARTAMLKSIQEILPLTSQIIPHMNELQYLNSDETNDTYCDNAASLTEMIMKSLLRLSDDAFRQIGLTAFADVCCQLHRICKTISIRHKNKHCYFDFKIFHSLVMLRLQNSKTIKSKDNGSSFSSFSQLTKVFGASTPLVHLAESYIIEGAGSEVVNGRYDLFKSDDIKKIVYIKQNFDEMNNGIFVEMHQCLHGENEGCWVISLHDEHNPDKDNDYYFNRIGIASSPTAGWKECGSGEIPAPKVTSIGRLSTKKSVVVNRGFEYDLTEHQRKLWDVLRQLSGPVVVSDLERTGEMKRAVLYSFSSLDTAELNETHQAFARCVQNLISTMFPIDRKRQLSITRFIAHRKKKKPAQDDAELPMIAAENNDLLS